MARKLANKRTDTLYYEAVEERVLFSADGVPGLDLSTVEGQALVDDSARFAPSPPPSAPSAAIVQETSVSQRELVIVNPNIDGYEQLTSNLRSGDANRIIEIAVLDPDRDGIAQVTELLEQRSDLSAVHFITHGADGQINLGNGWLNKTTLEQNADQIAAWGKALTDDGDMLFYGCNVAADHEGRSLVDSIARLTDADVAASEDLTGDAGRGGDWDLEYQAGKIDSSSAANSFNRSGWSQTLAAINVTTAADENDILSTATISDLQSAPGGTGISLREAIIAANNTAGADTIYLGAGTYTLSITNNGEDASAAGDLDITSDITIIGDSAGTTTISASGLADRAFDVKSGAALTLNDLTVADVYMSDQEGGAVSNAGTLSATDVVFRDNTVTNNPGGAIYNGGTTTLERVSIINNTASAGGGIELAGGTLNMTNVTVSGNSSLYNGAGIRVSKATATADISYTTVANNSTTSSGDAGGLYSINATVNIRNSIFVGNTSQFYSGDITGPVASGGNNIFEDVEGFTVHGTDQIGDPGLAALSQDPGNSQYVHAITDSSIACDAAGGSAPTTDQRGILRDASPDIGAFEVDSTNTPPVLDSAALTVTEGQTVTLSGADFGITDPDSSSFTYSLSAISGGYFQLSTATGTPITSFTSTQLAAGQVQFVDDGNETGPALSVTVNDGSADSNTLAATVTYSAANDAPAGSPIISGTAIEDQTLTADTSGISDADGLGTFSYQWLRDGSSIPGAISSTYALGDADVGAQISVQVDYTDGQGTSESLTSAATAAVSNVNDAPTGADNTITANEDPDYIFSASDFGFSDVDGDNLSRVWITTLPVQGQLRWNGSTFAAGNWVAATDIGAGLLTYTPVANTSGTGYASFTFQVEDDGGTANGGINIDPTPNTISIDVTPVNDSPIGLPAVTGTATENQSLTVNTVSISDADGLGGFSYQWLRDGSPIPGATSSTYTLSDADVGARISVQVDYTDGLGTNESLTSAATAAIANINDSPIGLPAITGTATENQTLTVNTGSISDADGLGGFSYQWLRDGSPISGATSNTYTLSDADVGAQISVQVSYTDGWGTDEALVSAPSAPVSAGDGGSSGQGDTGGDDGGLLDEDTAIDDAGTGEISDVDPGVPTDGILPDFPEPDIISDPMVEQDSVKNDDQPIIPPTIAETEISQEFALQTNGSGETEETKGPDDSREYVYLDDDLLSKLYYSKHSNLKSVRNAPASERSMTVSGFDLNSQDSKRAELPADYDLFRQQLDDTFRSQVEDQAFKTRLLTFTCTSLTAGVVSYLLKASSLVASFLSSLPAWRRFDPIAVFAGKKKKKSGAEQKVNANAEESRSEAFFDDGENNV